MLFCHLLPFSLLRLTHFLHLWRNIHLLVARVLDTEVAMESTDASCMRCCSAAGGLSCGRHNLQLHLGSRDLAPLCAPMCQGTNLSPDCVPRHLSAVLLVCPFTSSGLMLNLVYWDSSNLRSSHQESHHVFHGIRDKIWMYSWLPRNKINWLALLLL